MWLNNEIEIFKFWKKKKTIAELTKIIANIVEL